jgi:FecR-like protein
MNTTGNDTGTDGEDALETLLRHAAPRPVPPPQDEKSIREVLHAEWQTIIRRRQLRRRFRQVAIAASVLLISFAAINSIRIENLAAIEVAAIDKSFGSIYLLGDRSELQQTSGLLTLAAGQTVVTGEDAGIGLALNAGGSLRIDEKTRVEFLSVNEIYLRSGRIYLDSDPSNLAVGGSRLLDPRFAIHTDHGVVTHLGTQFMTYTDTDRLAVTVRDGKVRIDGKFYDETVIEGRQVIMIGSRRPTATNISGWGDAWYWIEKTVPTVDVDGRPVIDFLTWVSHETGLGLEFDSDIATQIAQRGTLRGTVDAEPVDALGIWMLGEDLDWRIDDGTIHISEIRTTNE